ncbi:MAG: ATP-binding cassette domain-containing protein [Planctomycetes bacterium]|jgi:ATP-binding cassette subfamily F protein 3|nr:ABC-F family ATP-binding cassette domain-containing protein [Phycisphaerae bacterium]NBB94207.1 ATP-binding cassette domain-containing protein [Planctomycetota bacterium]
MSIIIGENILHAYGTLEVLKHVSFRVSRGDRIGVVGPNGEGKTTLLTLIAGAFAPTAGDIHRQSGVVVGYLPQEPPNPVGVSIHDAMLAEFKPVRKMESELRALAERIEARPDDADLMERYGQLQATFDAAGGYNFEQRIAEVLTGLHFPREMWNHPLAELSGGQRTRAALAALLLKRPDVLLLDEPTNHLDIESVEWLEGYLGSYRGALLAVSHDRYFLDSVTRQTWEVAFGNLDVYTGGYSRYVEQRAERHKAQMREYEKQQEYVAKTRAFIDEHIAGQRTKEAQGRRTRLERFIRDEAMPRPPMHKAIGLTLSAARRAGDIVLRANDLVIGYAQDAPLLAVEQLEIQRGWRVAILGPNGCGKTTLLRTLLGELDALAGEIRPGANVATGYLSQTHQELSPHARAVDAVCDRGRRCREAVARDLLGALQLSGDDADKLISELSGGQRSRVILAQLMAIDANLLMLDEPTNHLDIPSTETLQTALQTYEGTLLFVSHDRYLVEAVATHVWAVEDGHLHVLPGGWDAYITWRDRRRSGTVSGASSDTESRAKRQATRQAARRQANEQKRLQRRVDDIESDIEAVETRLSGLNEQISAASQAGDMQTVASLGRQYETLDEQLRKLWADWEHLGEKLGSGTGQQQR